MRKYLLNRGFVSAVALWAAVLGSVPSNAFAFPSESLPAVSPLAVRDAQINKIMGVLSRPDAQLHLRLMGLSDAEVRAGLLKLDDGQLAQVSDQADTVRAGGSALGVVIAVLVIVLLIVLIMAMTNKKVEIKDAK